MKIVWIFGAVVLLAAVALLMLGNYIFQITIARTQPRKAAYREPPREQMTALDQKRYDARCALEAQDSRLLFIRSRDGLRLCGHFLPAENAVRTVIMAHGWRSSWARDFGMHAKFLHENGCNLLLTEQRGHGNSEGKYLGFGVLERFDCLAWLEEARKLSTQPFYLFGVSMGAASVLMAAGEGMGGDVAGIIADSGFTSPYAIIDHVMKGYSSRFHALLTALVAIICRLRAGYSLREYSTLRAMQSNKTPVLFIHGTKDHFVPMQMSLETWRACRSKKDFLKVDGAPHAKGYLIDPVGYENKVLQFFAAQEGRGQNA